jgi:hypothetical protein
MRLREDRIDSVVVERARMIQRMVEPGENAKRKSGVDSDSNATPPGVFRDPRF